MGSNAHNFPERTLPNQIEGLVPSLKNWDQTCMLDRASAIFVLFLPPLPGSSWARILFIRRSAHLRSHPSQIGFPGGRRESSDESPMQTALRETNEELGIPPERIAVLGALPEIKSLEGSPVIPIVGTTTMELDEMTPAHDEVAAIFAFEWPLFAHDKCHFFWLNLFGLPRRSSVFFAANIKIWGLSAHALYTARIG